MLWYAEKSSKIIWLNRFSTIKIEINNRIIDVFVYVNYVIYEYLRSIQNH